MSSFDSPSHSLTLVSACAFPAEQNSVSGCVCVCVPSDKLNTCEVEIVYGSKESWHLKCSCFRSALKSVPKHCITKLFLYT